MQRCLDCTGGKISPQLSFGLDPMRKRGRAALCELVAIEEDELMGEDAMLM